MARVRTSKASVVKCPHCRRQTNSLNLYSTTIGILCFRCLHGQDAQGTYHGPHGR